MIDPPKVAAARIEAARRRGEMLGTVHDLQSRLAPRTLASDAWAKARNKPCALHLGEADPHAWIIDAPPSPACGRGSAAG